MNESKENNQIEKHIEIDIENGEKEKIIIIGDEAFCPSRGLESKDKPLDYKSIWDIKQMMNGKFGFHEGELSNALDILSVYLKGQKTIYLEAKSYCEFYLNRLMMPCILLSSVCSVISGVFNEVPLAGKIIAGATALNAFLMSLISYYKLDARAEAHKMTAYSFDQLISECEFTSGKILLYYTNKNKHIKTDGKKDINYNIYDEKENDNKVIYDLEYFNNFINSIEKRVREIKEKNQFMIPDVIRKRYNLIYNLNVFNEIKEYQINELLLLNDLKVAYNDCRDFENKIIKDSKENPNPENYKLYRQAYLNKEEHFKKVINNRKKILRVGDKFKVAEEPEPCCKFFY